MDISWQLCRTIGPLPIVKDSPWQGLKHSQGGDSIECLTLRILAMHEAQGAYSVVKLTGMPALEVKTYPKKILEINKKYLEVSKPKKIFGD